MSVRRSIYLLVGVAAGGLAACDSGSVGGSGGAAVAEAEAPRAAAAVSADRLVNADREPGQWMSHGRTYWEQRFSPLAQITRDNVGELGLAWYADFDTARGQEATPLMVDGVIYVSTAWSKVNAYDAVTGEQLWSYDPEVPGGWAVKACCDVVNRGVAVWEGKVYVGTLDGRLVALDAATGEELWDVNTIDRTKPYTITGAPRVVKGKVLIGNGGAEMGVRGYVSAYDADTGELVWRFYTVPGNPADGFENPILERAAETWSGEWWTLGGGGTVWDSMAYDPELDLLYIGTGNGSPWNHTFRSNGEGDNWFLASIVALDPDDGSYVWHYQVSPGESWDHTATQQITIADLVIDGETRRVLMQAPKNGFFYVLDAATGELISAENFTEVAWATHIDLETGRPVETPEARYNATGKPFVSTHNPNGAHTWHSMSYSPQTGLVYMPIHGSPFVYSMPESFTPVAMAANQGLDFSGNAALDPDDVYAKTYGRLIAWDPVEQREVWRVERAGPANGGALSTAGGLVFQGTGSGQFTALDAETGEELWSTHVQTGVIAAPISYEIDGEQYVAIVVGTGGSWGVIGGATNMKGYALPNVSRLLVYKLGGTAQLPPAPTFQRPPMMPPPSTASEETIAMGAPLYETHCGSCHGAGVVGLGILPDLRRSAYLHDADAWAQVVIGGALEPRGMASFAPVLTPEQAQAVRAYVVMRANQDAAAEAAAQ
ncbi:MAG TPA: PQQ-dependent dehydrogenase, methanol/ethanol family [Gammaproteobacteria bacterium]